MKKSLALVLVALLCVVVVLSGCGFTSPGAKALGNPQPTQQSASIESTDNPTAVPETKVTETTSCSFTDSQVMSLFEFQAGDVVRTDAPWDQPKFTRQNVPSLISLKLLDGWYLTYTDNQGRVWTTIGKGQTMSVRGFTLRPPCNAISALGSQGYFDFEWGYGFASERGSAKFATCPDSNYPKVNLTSEQSAACGVSSSATEPIAETSSNPCSDIDAEWLSANIGGDSSNWAAPTDPDGAWAYKNKGVFITFKYPGTGYLDVWTKESGPTSVTSKNVEVLSESFDEVSYHCQ